VLVVVTVFREFVIGLLLVTKSWRTDRSNTIKFVNRLTDNNRQMFLV